MIDKLVYIYADSEVSWVKDALREGLPADLAIQIIAYLWACCEKNNSKAHSYIYPKYFVLIRRDIEKGELQGVHVNQDKKYTADCVNKNIFKQWLIDRNEWPVTDNLLKFWWNESERDKEAMERDYAHPNSTLNDNVENNLSAITGEKANFYDDFLNREKLTPEISTKLILDINPYLPDDSIDNTKHLEYLNLLDKINEACENEILITEEYTYLDFEPNLNPLLTVKEFLQRKKVEYTGYKIFTHSLIIWCNHHSINIDKRTEKTNQIKNHLQDKGDGEKIIPEQENSLGINKKRAMAIKSHLETLEQTAKTKDFPFDKKKLLCSRKMLLNWIKEKSHKPTNLFDIKQSTFEDFWGEHVKEYNCCPPASVNVNFFKEIQG